MTKTGKFSVDYNSFQNMEDTWSKRLFGALVYRFKHFDVEYTASFKGPVCNSVVINKLPSSTSLDVLYFIGRLT